MLELDGRYWIGISNEPAGTNGGIVASVAANGTLMSEYAVDEQGVHDMHLHDDKIYIPGTDPTDDWTLGNIYVRDVSGVWHKRRTLPLTLHTWGLCHDPASNLWAAVGAHAGDNATWEGRVLRSVDDGLTWDTNTLLNDYRVYDIEYHAGAFWCIGYTATYSQVLYTSDDGIIWLVVDGIEPERLHRFVAHDGKLICLQSSRSGLIVIDESKQVSMVALPFVFRCPSLNCIASDGTYIYCICENGYVWRTGDLDVWTRYSFLSGAINVGYWPSENCLIASNIGTSAKLYKVNL